MLDMDDGYVLWTGIWKGMYGAIIYSLHRLCQLRLQHWAILKVRLVCMSRVAGQDSR